MLVHNNMSFTYHLETSKENKQIEGQGEVKKTQDSPSSEDPWECDRKWTTLPTNFKVLTVIKGETYEACIIYQALC